ncbi:FtsB family cell division protein [Macrococcus armenti]|uniref:FtsB family cell division protein n=1 Tax=Macrococcus armenti TaxID=2875764 RepID=UPI001CCF5249|nr:septum formation initiator family protein [Macrococcus armenti]UBH08544.1 septum formation initiator family protein [Macrococcus armenti]UBH10829.1 septum formation initiator family protein [Macrococcus armenti]UBH15310.1 septum formation initiator family protein [Macrococcus armenti]UBH17668.1 septum formation initiator family protein [Macrococcus armenti]UBH19935.1 septum formation initiator family protein [Macrococcus armenti]
MAKKVSNIENEYISERELQARHKRKTNKVVKRRLFVFGGGLLLILLFLSGLMLYQMSVNRHLKEEHAKQTAEYKKLQEKEIVLRERLKQLNSKEYIEKIARSEYFLSNDGEVIFKLPDSEESKSTEQP